MHEAKYTPGPWALQGNSTVIAPNMPRIKYGKNEEYERAYIVCQPDLYTDPEWGGEEKRANARLIATAPEMLERIEMCKRFLEDMHTQSPEVTVAVSQTLHETLIEIIAKATGK